MSLLSTYNYLVPAAGTTSALVLNNVVENVTRHDLSQSSAESGLTFNPSGVVIDNIAGTAIVQIQILPTNFNINCPIGKQMGIQFPAPSGATAIITANGANIAFVDYPVIPYMF